MSRDSKNDEAWQKIFEKHNIINRIESDGRFIITADQIKEFREPRLMTKFDNRGQLPSLFQTNKLSILPITRGSYSISNYKVYHKFEELQTPIIEVPYPDYLQSINWEDISSEATAINVTYITNILSDFLQEEGLVPTVNGRMGSKEFDYFIYNNKLKQDQKIFVKNSQIEVDGGFEGFHALSIIEAKNVLSEDFLVRQLYYPYRLWNKQITKPVRPVYLTYSNNVFSLYEYKFENEMKYNSLKLVNSNRYTLRQDPITLDDLLSIFKSVQFVEEDRETPFVQADSFYRVINMCELLFQRDYLTSNDIVLEYGFTDRQSDYYFNAGKYLGLMKKNREENEIRVILTELGKKTMQMTIKDRNLTYARLILSHKVFHRIFDYYLNQQSFPDTNTYVEIMKEHNLNIGEGRYEMYKRRSSSITGWINWVFNLIRY